jgi:hypothetical protein
MTEIEKIGQITEDVKNDPGAAVDLYFDQFLNQRFLKECKAAKAVIIYSIENDGGEILCAKRKSGENGFYVQKFEEVFLPKLPFFIKKLVGKSLGFDIDEIFQKFQSSILDFLKESGFRLSFVPQNNGVKIYWANHIGESGEVLRDEIKSILKKYESAPQNAGL